MAPHHHAARPDVSPHASSSPARLPLVCFVLVPLHAAPAQHAFTLTALAIHHLAPRSDRNPAATTHALALATSGYVPLCVVTREGT